MSRTHLIANREALTCLVGITVEKKFAEVMDQIEELAGQNRIVGDES